MYGVNKMPLSDFHVPNGVYVPDGVWITQICKVRGFINKYGRTPSNSDQDDERKLAIWCAEQKMKRGRGELSCNQIMDLECFPGWSWITNSNWTTMFRKLLLFVQTHSRLPRHDEEIELIKWCDVVRKKHYQYLTRDQIAVFNQLPGWSWHVDTETWDESYAQLKEYVQEHDKLPKWEWCDEQRQLQVQDEMSDEKIEKLDQIKGWYWHRYRTGSVERPTTRSSKRQKVD